MSMSENMNIFWADLMVEAGQKFLIITSKHHDGFCLWDSAFTNYKATRTPWGKDLVPTYLWSDGTRNASLVGDTIDPSAPVVLNAPGGEKRNPAARIFPARAGDAAVLRQHHVVQRETLLPREPVGLPHFASSRSTRRRRFMISSAASIFVANSGSKGVTR